MSDPAILWDQDRFALAYRFAARRHHQQTMPGSGMPYMVHIGLVCSELMAVCEPELNNDLMLVCGALHDCVEDTSTSRDEIAELFGESVADGVSALSKDKGIQKTERLRDSLRRIRLEPKEIWLVKMADRITNLSPPPAEWDRERRLRYLEDAKEIHAALSPASRLLGLRLETKLKEYAQYID